MTEEDIQRTRKLIKNLRQLFPQYVCDVDPGKRSIFIHVSRSNYGRIGSIMMEFDDPEDENQTVEVEYIRDDIINTTMTIVTTDGEEEHLGVELQDYSADDGTLMLAELWESFFTFYLGEPIERGDVNVFPMEE